MHFAWLDLDYNYHIGYVAASNIQLGEINQRNNAYGMPKICNNHLNIIVNYFLGFITISHRILILSSLEIEKGI